METVNVQCSDIAKYAFEKLRRDGNVDAANRLAASLVWGKPDIKLGLGDIDNEIEQALNYCMGSDFEGDRQPYTFSVSRYGIVFRFAAAVSITKEQDDRNRVEFID